jgi:hypothetical protein
MLIHQQNVYAPCSKRHTSHHEAQSCEMVNGVKKLSVLLSASVLLKMAEREMHQL